MSRALTIFVILSALATGSAIVLGLVAETVALGPLWPDFTRAVAVVSWIVGALVWCTERICARIDSLREAATKRDKRMIKELRSLEILARERIEAAHQVQNLFDPQRRRSGTDR